MQARAFQDQISGNQCFGCGADNKKGLQIKSYWSESTPGDTVCTFQGLPHHNAGNAHVLNGGIIATVMDCHSVITALAQAYQDESREIGTAPRLWYVTGSFDLSYKAPAPLNDPVSLRARVTESSGRKSRVECELMAGDTLCTRSTMVAVRVPMEWHDE